MTKKVTVQRQLAWQEAKRNAYLKSGSARKEEYFKVSLHGTSDRTLSSSSTYCNMYRSIHIRKKIH